MNEYVECQECGFVVLSTGESTPEPKRVDDCPSCGTTEFDFLGESRPEPNVSSRRRRSGLES